MTELSSLLARFVPSRVRKRGLQYFRSRNVSVHSSSPDEVTATVTGTDRYRVRLARDAKEVVASCSCPYFTDRRELRTRAGRVLKHFQE